MVIADIAETKGTALAKRLGSQALFRRCDVTSEAEVLAPWKRRSPRSAVWTQ